MTGKCDLHTSEQYNLVLHIIAGLFILMIIYLTSIWLIHQFSCKCESKKIDHDTLSDIKDTLNIKVINDILLCIVSILALVSYMIYTINMCNNICSSIIFNILYILQLALCSHSLISLLDVIFGGSAVESKSQVCSRKFKTTTIYRSIWMFGNICCVLLYFAVIGIKEQRYYSTKGRLALSSIIVHLFNFFIQLIAWNKVMDILEEKENKFSDWSELVAKKTQLILKVFLYGPYLYLLTVFIIATSYFSIIFGILDGNAIINVYHYIGLIERILIMFNILINSSGIIMGSYTKFNKLCNPLTNRQELYIDQEINMGSVTSMSV